MKKSYIPALIIMAAALAACGGTDFEWFPKVEDTTPPVVTASISNATFQNSSSTTVHASSLPATVTFSADEPATIYYTTNGTDPSTTSPSVEFSVSPVPSSGISVTVTNTILKFFGIDKSKNLNKSTTKAVTIVSP